MNACVSSRIRMNLMPMTQDKMLTKHHPEDVVVWPDGTHADYAAVERGEYSWMSDDYEIVPAENAARLRELGVAVE